MSTIYYLATECPGINDDEAICDDDHRHEIAHICTGTDGKAEVILREHARDFPRQIPHAPESWKGWKSVLERDDVKVENQYEQEVPVEQFIIMVEKHSTRESRQAHHRWLLEHHPDLVTKGQVGLDPEGYTISARPFGGLPHPSAWHGESLRVHKPIEIPYDSNGMRVVVGNKVMHHQPYEITTPLLPPLTKPRSGE